MNMKFLFLYICKLLIKFFCCFFYQSGFMLLYIVCVYGYFELVRLLIEVGVEIEGKIKNGYIVFYLVVQYGYRFIIDLLLECGVNFNVMINVSIVDEFFVYGLFLL